MHDPEFDDVPSKRDAPAAPPIPRAARYPEPAHGRPRWPSLAWPIRLSDQAVFAEAFRHGLERGLPADRAVALAAEVNRCRRLRRALARMATGVRSGYSLETALSRTGAGVSPGLLAALRVGEELGCLGEELSAFAARHRSASPARFLRAIGRSPEATRFAAALARLLREHRLTVRVVRAAGLIAGAGGGSFSRAVDDIARRMENGGPFVDALRRHPAHFDALYCGLLDAAESRDEMRACLERLGGPA
jgi:type II secretory pathway component PulF